MGLNCWLTVLRLVGLTVPSCLLRLLRLVLPLQLEDWGSLRGGRPGPTADTEGLARLARLAPCGRAGRAGPAAQGRKNNWKIEVTTDGSI